MLYIQCILEPEPELESMLEPQGTIQQYCDYKINSNPHCFIAIIKATACGQKEPLLPYPLHSPVGEGEGGCYLYDPEDLLNKNVSYT
jgi:hypothetical protein